MNMKIAFVALSIVFLSSRILPGQFCRLSQPCASATSVNSLRFSFAAMRFSRPFASHVQPRQPMRVILFSIDAKPSVPV